MKAPSIFSSYFRAIAAAASLPLVVGIAIEGYSAYGDRADSDAEIRRLEAGQAANEIQSFVRQLAAVLADISQTDSSLAVKGNRRERAIEYRRLLTVFKPINRVMWLDGQGLEVIRLDRREVDELAGTAISTFAPIAAKVRESGTLQFFDDPSADARKRQVIAGIPTAGSDLGVLLLRIDLRFVNDLLANLHFAHGGYVFVTDQRGQVIAHANANLALRTTSFPDATRSSGVADALSDVPSADGKREQIRFSTRRLDQPPWIVVAAQPDAEASAWISTFLWRVVGLLAATLLGAALFAAWNARRLSRPIAELVAGARGLMDGRVVQLQTPSRNAELRELATQFTAMAANVTTAQAELESKVELKTRDLAEANAKLVVASQHKSDFLAQMSHELRTPLNAVIGFSEMLKAQYFGPLNEKQAEYVRDIHSSGQHLLLLINDILDLAKVEAGRMELLRSDTDVVAVIDACCALVSERFARKHQVLTVDLAPDVGMWSLDERKFKQCLLNLLSNAGKFTAEGGRIALRTRLVEDVLEVEVSDNGVGIAAEEIPKLFSEFYQVGAAGGEMAYKEGTGLGLALTKKFVELHGGTVEVRSQPGEGASFTLRFPVSEEHSSAHPGH